MREAAKAEKQNVRQPLGRRISSLRKSKGMTLSEVAEICGVSEATMSRIETGQTDISAHHLFILANEFGADIAEFFTDHAKPLTSGMRSVTRSGEAKGYTLARYATEVLCADLSNKDMHPAINHVTAESLEEVGGLWSHEGQEFLHVLKGSIVLHSEFYVPLSLDAGDSVYFEGSMKHAYVKSGKEPATILVVVGPSKGIGR